MGIGGQSRRGEPSDWDAREAEGRQADGVEEVML